MSKYETCETKIKVEDKDVLLEAIIRTLKLHWNIDAQPQDIEFHEVATNLLGYVGDIRPQKANVIIRGCGVNRHPDGKYAPNKLPPAYNDFGLTEKDGYYTMELQNFDSGNVIAFKDALLNMINAIKLTKHVFAHQEVNPSCYLVNEETQEPITTKDDVINYVYGCYAKGKDAAISLEVPDSGTSAVQTDYSSIEYVPKMYSGTSSKSKKKDDAKKIKERRKWKRK